MNVREFLHAYAQVCRMEYLPAEAPGVLIPLFLGSTSLLDFSKLQVIESLLVFILLYWAGFLINALADVDVDSRYKTHVSHSVNALGVTTIQKLLVFHVVTAMLITLHICYLLSNYWIFLWVMIGTFFGLGYSLKPFHFKVRGPLHATLAFSALFTPFVFLYYVIAGMPPVPTILIVFSLATIHYGFALVNQSQDYLDDKESNLRTPAVRWGLTRTLRIAFSLAFIGLCLYFISLYLLFSMIPGFSLFGYTLSLELVFTLVTISLALGYFIPMRGLRDLIKISLSTQEIEQKMALIKKRLNYPRWQFCGLLGSMIVALIYFVL